MDAKTMADPTANSPVPFSAWLELPDGRSHWLVGNLCSIGRAKGKDLILADPHVSSSHALIELAEAGVHKITDLRSTNGTVVNGRRINAPEVLFNGSVVELGSLRLLYRCLKAPEQAGDVDSENPTLIKTYEGPCWLLLLDLESFTSRRQQLGPAKAEELIRHWIGELKPCIENGGGVLNSQPGDALFCFWRVIDATTIAPLVCKTLRRLIELQAAARNTHPFRIVLHFGEIQISTNAVRGEQLAGSDADFLFRIEKLARPLKKSLLLSESAALRLKKDLRCVSLGSHSVKDFTGKHHLYGLC